MSVKTKHKELKNKVNLVERTRNYDRSFSSWLDLKTLKKLKLQAKDKLNETKSKLFA
jgi:uncharacterized protein YdcH (DUF465 family)